MSAHFFYDFQAYAYYIHKIRKNQIQTAPLIVSADCHDQKLTAISGSSLNPYKILTS